MSHAFARGKHNALCSEHDVRPHAEKYGPVRDIYIPKDYHTQQPKGIAFVEFTDARDCEDALDLEGLEICDRSISVNIAKEQRKSAQDFRRRDRYDDRRGGYDDRRGGGYGGRDRYDDRRGGGYDDRRGGYDDRRGGYGGGYGGRDRFDDRRGGGGYDDRRGGYGDRRRSPSRDRFDDRRRDISPAPPRPSRSPAPRAASPPPRNGRDYSPPPRSPHPPAGRDQSPYHREDSLDPRDNRPPVREYSPVDRAGGDDGAQGYTDRRSGSPTYDR